MQFVGGLSILAAPTALLVGRIFVASLAVGGVTASIGAFVLTVGIMNFNE
jgi:hypothetical protein